MLRNWLAAALRNLARSRLYAAISIFGLGFGIAAALIAALVLRAETTYDAYVPARERTYVAALRNHFPSQLLRVQTDTHPALAGLLKINLPQIEAVARAASARGEMRRGDVHARERFYWADANLFDLLPLHALAGDLRTALSRPDGLVITPEISKKYFGTERALGETLLINGVPMRVTAIVEAPPAHHSVLDCGLFASALAEQSSISRAERDPKAQAANGVAKTLLRLPAGATPDRFGKPMDVVLRQLFAGRGDDGNGPSDITRFFQLELLRLDRLHLDPEVNPGVRERLALIGATGLLILLVACINFVNLATARAATRATEVGVRKALGASRGALFVQFLGEAFLYVLFAALLAAMATELLLPSVNAFLETDAAPDFLRDPAALGLLLLGVAMLAVVAGAYPAVVLSAFNPATVLKGDAAHSRAANVARQLLVIAQFGVLIAFIIAAVVIYQQRSFAASGGVRAATDQHYLIQRVPCDSAFAKEIPRLPGVRGMACASSTFIGNLGFSTMKQKDGTYLTLTVAAVDDRGLPLYGVAPIAGRLFRDGEAAHDQVVINEAAVRKLGYGTPERALGKVLPVQLHEDHDSEVIGVVRDFGILMVDETLPIAPTVFMYQPEQFDYLDIKLSGQSLPETLASLDALWKRTMSGTPPPGRFVDQIIEENYRTMLRQAHLFGILSVVAVVLSCLGLIGLSSAATARRTREIGVRKAMGASRGQITQLLLWQFSRPVLLAALVACPVAALLLRRWLDNFAYHVDLAAWPFFASTVLTLCVALLTVSAHCYSVAREKPVRALRYE